MPATVIKILDINFGSQPNTLVYSGGIYAGQGPDSGPMQLLTGDVADDAASSTIRAAVEAAAVAMAANYEIEITAQDQKLIQGLPV